MKIIYAALSVCLLTPTLSKAHGPALSLPVHIICEQTNEQINGWTDFHLFSIPKPKDEASARYTAHGTYKRYALHNGHPSGPLKSNEGSGQVTLQATHAESSYTVNAVAFQQGNSHDPSPHLPRFVLGGSLYLHAPTAASEFYQMVRDEIFTPQSYIAKCRFVDEATARKF